MLGSRLFFFGLVITCSIIPDQAGAVPAFARRYKISCTTCHAPFPRLKPYGEEFAGNGFIIPEEERERDYVTGGDDLLWLNRQFPLAVRFDAYAVWDQNHTSESDLQIPWGLKLLSGGALSKGIGYYFYFYMSERGEVAGIEDAYVHFNDLFGSDLDVMVGQFQTSDPLMKRELRLTYEDYQIYKTRIGNSQTNLAYDRGLMFAYGISETGTDLVAYLVNGNGKGEADETTKKFDLDKYKNVGFRILQDLGGMASLGGFVAYGKESIGENLDNEVTYYGPDLHLGLGPVEITGQYLFRKDTNPDFLAADSGLGKSLADPRKAETSLNKDTETEGWVVELVFAPQRDRSRHYFTLLYNQIDSDYSFETAATGQNGNLLQLHDYETLTLSATYLLKRNLRFLAEYTRVITALQTRDLPEPLGMPEDGSAPVETTEVIEIDDLNRFTLGLVGSF
jgi:hypothetical protein